jgi:TIR domain
MEAGRLADTIRTQFGKGSVFIDVSDARLGEQWPDRIEQALGQATVVVAVIGPGWIRAADEYGRRRIDNPKDWVHREIELSLESGKTIIPLLVRHEEMFPAEALPPRLGRLTTWRAYKLRASEWQQDVEYVLGQLQPLLGSRARTGSVEVLPDDAQLPAMAADDLRALAAGFDSRHSSSRIKTAKQITEVAPGVTLDDVLAFCHVRKTAERVAGTIALGVHIRSSRDVRTDPGVHAVLRELMHDRSSLVRYRAAEVVRKSPSLVASFSDELEALAASDENRYVQDMAGKALQRMRV